MWLIFNGSLIFVPQCRQHFSCHVILVFFLPSHLLGSVVKVFQVKRSNEYFSAEVGDSDLFSERRVHNY